MTDALDQSLEDHLAVGVRVCVFQHRDGICGHLEETYNNLHGPLDYADVPGNLGRALREWASGSPGVRGARHLWTPGYGVAVIRGAAPVHPGQLKIEEAP